MADYTVYYWPGFSGRAEPILVLLTDAGKSFEMRSDVREFLQANTGFPAFACPILVKGEEAVSQTTAILKWVGDELGYGGAAASAHRVLQTTLNAGDIWSEAYSARKGEDKGAAFLKERLAKWLTVVEGTLAQSSGEYLIGDVSYADFAFLNVVGVIEFMFGAKGKSVIAAFDRIVSWRDTMMQREGVKRYFSAEGVLPVLYDSVRAAE